MRLRNHKQPRPTNKLAQSGPTQRAGAGHNRARTLAASLRVDAAQHPVQQSSPRQSRRQVIVSAVRLLHIAVAQRAHFGAHHQANGRQRRPCLVAVHSRQFRGRHGVAQRTPELGQHIVRIAASSVGARQRRVRAGATERKRIERDDGVPRQIQSRPNRLPCLVGGRFLFADDLSLGGHFLGREYGACGACARDDRIWGIVEMVKLSMTMT